MRDTELSSADAVKVVLAVATITFASSFIPGLVLRPEWQSQELGWTAVDDGYYESAWNSKGELQLAWIGIYGVHYALMFGQRVDGAWNLTAVAALAYEYQGVSMAIDAGDRVHICTYAHSGVDYTSLGPNVLYATNAYGGWSVEILNVTHACTSAAVAVDAQDRVHVLYSRVPYYEEVNGNSSIVDMVKTSQGWDRNVLKTRWGPGNELQIRDVDGRPDGSIGMIYVVGSNWDKYDNSASGVLNYSILSEGQFAVDTELEPLDYVWAPNSLCHDVSGHAYVGIFRKQGDDCRLWYLTDRGGTWTGQDVAYAGGGRYHRPGGIAIFTDSQGAIHMGYNVRFWDGNYTNHSMRYSTNKSGQWETTILDESSGWDVDTIEVTADSRQNAHVAYFQRTTSTKHGDHDVSVYATNEPDDRFIWNAMVFSFTVMAPFAVMAVATVLLILRSQTQRRRIRLRMNDTGIYDDLKRYWR